MAEYVVQVARDALALGNFGEVLNFIVREPQLGERAIALRKESIGQAYANRDNHRSAPETQRGVEENGIYTQNHDQSADGYQRASRVLEGPPQEHRCIDDEY